MAITAQTRTDIVELVVSMLGAAPSTAQLTDLVKKANAGSTVQELADSLATNTDFAANYPVWLTAKEFTTKVVTNMFSGGTVTAADQDAAIDYIAGAITAGTFTKTSAVVALTSYMSSADGLANASYGSASQAYQNKVAVAEYYTITKGLGGSSKADLAAAIAGVTSDAATVTSGQAAADNAVTAAAAKVVADAAAAAKVAADAAAAAEAAAKAGQSDTLTTGLNTITGTANDDTVSALTSTLTVGDSYDGLGGTDTVSLTSSLNGNTSVAGFTLSNIENLGVNMTSAAAGAETLTLNLATTDTDRVTLSGLSVSTGNDTLRVDNVAAGTIMALSSSTDLNLTANYQAAATKGTTAAGTGNTVDLEVSAVTRTAGGDNTVTIGNGFETINVKSAGAASRLDQITSNSEAMNVTGDANLTIDTRLDATLYAINASDFTGKLSIATTNNGAPDLVIGGVDIADTTITGGSGNDTINVSNNAADNEINVNGGAGNDTVIIGAATAAAAANGSNPGDVLNGGDGVDILSFTSAGLSGLTKAVTTGISGFETINVNNVLGNNITAANVQATGITTVNLAAGGTGTIIMPAGASTVSLGSSLTGALVIQDTGTAQTDSVTISNSKITADDMGDANNVTITGFETLSIVTTAVGDTSQDFGAIAITGDPLNDKAATTTLNFSGGDRATVGAITATTLDLTGLSAQGTGNTFVMTAPTSIVTINGSEGKDTLIGDAKSTINGNGGNDTITGGTGNDTLNGGAGNDTITTGASTLGDTVDGGAGNDTIVLAGNLDALDKIDGGDGVDILSVDNASLVALQALTISEANTFNTNFNGVEVLAIGINMDSTNDKFDLGYLSGIVNVSVATLANDAETISGFDTGSTLTLNATLGQALTATVSGATASATEVLNVTLAANADTNYGTLNIGNVETVNVNSTQLTAAAASQTGTLSLGITQTSVLGGGSGAAQAVNFSGSEDVVLGAALNAATINASGMSARLATTPGLVMNSAAAKTLAMPGQTVTGSSGADTLFGSTGADIITAGAGNDTVSGSTGADTITGGTGTDTLTNAGMVGTALEGTGTGNQTGVVINLGSTALTNVAVLNATAQNLSGTLTSVPAGGVGYVYNNVANTNSAAVDTVSGFDNVTLSANGINMVVGNDNANVVVGGTGTDYIATGKGADTINVGDAVNVTATDLYTGGAGADSVLVTADDNSTGAVFDDMTGVETITAVVSATPTENLKVTLTSTAASTQAFTVDASALTNAGAVFTFVASDAEVDGVLTITGGAGNDIITTGDGAATVTGGGGNDAITLDTGANTINVPFGGSGVDTISAFVAANTDVFTFTGTTDVNDAAGSDLDLDGFLAQDANASHVLVDGLTVFGSDNQKTVIDAGATVTAGEIETYLADIGAGSGNQTVTVATAADVAYILVQGAAGAATLAKVTGGANTVIDTADITIIAHFMAFDTDTATAANFAGFA